VLAPLVEIAPDLVVKGLENVVDLLNKLQDSEVKLIN
jgi:7,8-dihydro-6-hydroxymethylpterin-pyrophosphokinase